MFFYFFIFCSKSGEKLCFDGNFYDFLSENQNYNALDRKNGHISPSSAYTKDFGGVFLVFQPFKHYLILFFILFFINIFPHVDCDVTISKEISCNRQPNGGGVSRISYASSCKAKISTYANAESKILAKDLETDDWSGGDIDWKSVKIKKKRLKMKF